MTGTFMLLQSVFFARRTLVTFMTRDEFCISHGEMISIKGVTGSIDMKVCETYHTNAEETGMLKNPKVPQGQLIITIKEFECVIYSRETETERLEVQKSATCVKFQSLLPKVPSSRENKEKKPPITQASNTK